MARARSSGGAYAWALVVLGCGFVVALLVAIIFYTKIEQARNAEEAAKNELETYVNVGQDSQELQPWLRDNGNNSAARALLNEIDTLRGTVDFLTSEKARLESTLAEANTRIERTQAETEDRDEQLIRQQAQAQAALEEAQTRATQLEQNLVTMTSQRDALSKTLTDTMTDANASAQRQIDQLNTRLAGVNADINEAEDVITELRGAIRQMELDNRDEIEVPPVTSADGEVLSVFNNGGQLFINRGRNQGVMLGLTFDVFGANEVISLSTTGSARGKATIEVYELRDDTAACRVVRRTRGAQVVPGDVIANIVYDPNKEFTFYAYGFFDIENNGGTSDLGRIENLVKQWGGTVAELEADEDGLPILSPEIDFLILGQQPVFPDDLDADELDPEVIQEWQARVREYETYQSLLADAKVLRIPILNQNRFLDLVGYYVR